MSQIWTFARFYLSRLGHSQRGKYDRLETSRRVGDTLYRGCWPGQTTRAALDVMITDIERYGLLVRTDYEKDTRINDLSGIIGFVLLVEL